MPTAIPRCISQPPNQYTSAPDAVWTSRIAQNVTVATAAASAITSATARFTRPETAVISPAASSGTAIASGATVMR